MSEASKAKPQLRTNITKLLITLLEKAEGKSPGTYMERYMAGLPVMEAPEPLTEVQSKPATLPLDMSVEEPLAPVVAPIIRMPEGKLVVNVMQLRELYKGKDSKIRIFLGDKVVVLPATQANIRDLLQECKVKGVSLYAVDQGPILYLDPVQEAI